MHVPLGEESDDVTSVKQRRIRERSTTNTRRDAMTGKSSFVVRNQFHKLELLPVIDVKVGAVVSLVSKPAVKSA